MKKITIICNIIFLTLILGGIALADSTIGGFVPYNTVGVGTELVPVYINSNTYNTPIASLSTLGTSTTQASPHISSSATTGFYSSAAGTINATISGTKAMILDSTTVALGIGATAANNGVALGYYANASGNSDNTAIGFSALYTGGGSQNVALGYTAMYSDTVGYDNVAIGSSALYNTATGDHNTAIGFGAGSSVTTGNNNVLIGASVGTNTLTIGSNNIIVGTSLDTTTSAISNFINIGGVWQGDNTIYHSVVSGSLAAVTSGATDCGTSPSIAGNDNVGRTTVGTSPSGKCTVRFANAWTTAPVCKCNNETSQARNCSALSTTITSTALTATTSPFTAADKLGYDCRGYQL